jgi:hypothetical protein
MFMEVIDIRTLLWQKLSSAAIIVEAIPRRREEGDLLRRAAQTNNITRTKGKTP